MNVGIIVFPGSNCDHDVYTALKSLNIQVDFYWHNKKLPAYIDAVIIPGGFSYGDYLRPGLIASHSSIMTDIKKLAEKGMPILGICNGFQILVESNILPGALLKNSSLNFMCKLVNLVVYNNNTPFTNKLKLHQSITIPIANGDGRYYVDHDTLQLLQKNNQIVFQYADNVNNSINCIAGVCNEDMNVVGMMPHPERVINSDKSNELSSLLIFKSILKTIGIEN